MAIRVRAAAKRGHKATLVAARDTLAAAIEGGQIPGYKLADALRNLADLVKEIEGVEARENGDSIGEAAATPDEAWSPTGGLQGDSS